MKEDELGKREAEAVNEEELDRKVQEAEDRIRERPLTWRPQEGDKKAVEILEREDREIEFGKTPFFVVKDLKTSQLYSLLAPAVLEKHLEVGKQYLLIYEGKIQNGDKTYHRWTWEELH